MSSPSPSAPSAPPRRVRAARVAPAARDRRRGDRGRVARHRDLRAADRAARPARAELRRVAVAVGAHLFGTDELGRDVLSRVIYGARVSVPIALLLVGLAATIGGLVGALAGYFRGVVDGVLMRVVDLVFAFPPIILAMVVTAVLGRGLRNAALAIVVVAWPSYARVVRGLVLSVGDSEYVQSARLLGASSRRALFRDVLPNVAGPVLVLATLDLANAILLLSGLSFLGLGAQPPQAGVGVDGRRRRTVLPVVVDGHLPGARDLHGGARVQLPRRQPARRLRSADVVAGRGLAGMSALLEVEGLRVRLPTAAGLVTIVNGVDYAVEPGEVFGVAGESGSGKTISMLALLGLLPAGAVTDGRALFGGNDLLRLKRSELRDVCGRDIGMVFQDPMTSLHPMLTIGRQLTEHVRRLGHDKRAAELRALELLDQVRIPDPRSALRAYPHQFSGGMRQRIAIAIALACGPKLLIADEPTTALDVTVQAGILRLLDRLRRENDLSVVLITHDLGVMSAIADRISIFYAGRVVESGPRGRTCSSARAIRTRARCSTRCRIRRRRRTRRSSRSTARRRARSESRPAVRSTRAARTRSTSAPPTTRRSRR